MRLAYRRRGRHRERSGRTPRIDSLPKRRSPNLTRFPMRCLLEHIFGIPKTMPAQEMKHLLGVFFDAGLGTPARHHRN